MASTGCGRNGRSFASSAPPWFRRLAAPVPRTVSRSRTAKRKALNDFIRTSGTFDGVIDFDKAALDPQSGGLKPEFVPDSTTGGPGDKLHPNRTGYLAMGQAIDLNLFKPGRANRTAKSKD